jgi:hypothetical protein
VHKSQKIKGLIKDKAVGNDVVGMMMVVVVLGNVGNLARHFTVVVGIQMQDVRIHAGVVGGAYRSKRIHGREAGLQLLQIIGVHFALLIENDQIGKSDLFAVAK